MTRWLPFEWIVALRFLREGRLQTLFIVSGVAIGVAVIVFMSALLTGLQANFIRRVLTAQAHIQLLPPKEVARPLRPPRRRLGHASRARSCRRRCSALKSIDQWQAIVGPDPRDARRDASSRRRPAARRWPCAATRAARSR